MKNLKLFNIQRTCVYDGPGLRTTLFFKGCNLRCAWCQNPEGQSFDDDIESCWNYSADEILEEILRDKEYYLATHGGITLSGGEPLAQNPESLEFLLKKIKEQNIPVAAETALHVPWANVKQLAPYIDLFLVDLKVVGRNGVHEELTQQDPKLIYDNIKKLLKLDANIKFRMVMVPGFNDREEYIESACNYLKSINYDNIELLKYHNMYETKSKELGLEFPQLNISQEESVDSVQTGLDLFKKYGVSAEYVDLGAVGKKTEYTPRVNSVHKDIRESKRGLCIEVEKLKTKYYNKHKGWKKPLHIHRSERLAYVCRNKKVKIYPNELIVGNFTNKRVAGHPWVEYYGVLMLTTIYRIGWQKPTPFHVSLWEKIQFYLYLVPNWLFHSIVWHLVPRVKSLISMMSRNSRVVHGFNNNLAAICHFIANYSEILELGTSGFIEKIRKIQKENPQNNQEFYDAAIIGLEGLQDFGVRYAKELKKIASKENDPERKRELEQMSKVCERVPKYPARTFHEALQSITFIHIALCWEQYPNAISFGRLDQILYPYYKKDADAGRITYEEAKELICLFILKMEELILVNDGDSFLRMANMFETVSTDQAVTIGGVDQDGNDATNDVTYMFLDACELRPVSLDIGARVHEDSPEEYMDRLAEIYLTGCPVPQLFGDNVYIKSLLKHYDTTMEHARNYSIVGCVEPNASDDHFGNTDCANVNLATPLIEALKGHTKNQWWLSFPEYLRDLIVDFTDFLFNMKPVTKFLNKIREIIQIKNGKYKYDPPSNMDELLARFNKRLRILTKSVLKEHQMIEEMLRENYTTPLASSLFPNCLKTGKDTYEGGAYFNSSGIQAVGVTDVADSLHAIEEVVYKKKLYPLETVIKAMDYNFKGKYFRKVRKALEAVPKFGDDSSPEASQWVTRVMGMWNDALDSVSNVPRNGRYSAGYYALNVCNRYGELTPALPSGRLAGYPLANSIAPHFGMKQNNLLSALNSVSQVDFVEHAENGTTATFTIDSSLFQGEDGIQKLANMFKTYLTKGGMQLQPNIMNREVLLDAYHNPDKYPNLLVRIAGYCEYFNQLSDEMKWVIINRTCYSA